MQSHITHMMTVVYGINPFQYNWVYGGIAY